jgi:hypothetical protein
MLQILVVKARPLRGAWTRTLAIAVVGATLGGLSAWQRLPRAASPVAPAPASALRPGPFVAQDETRAAEQQCVAARNAIAALPGVALPAVDQPELRAQLLGRSKAAPVLFLSEPPVDTENRIAVGLRRDLERSPGYQMFDRVVGKVRADPALARAVFLRDGYLYTDMPELATLYGTLTLSLLFRDAELHIWRGAEELTARRDKDGDYEYSSGPDRGRRAKLLLFDRVAASGALRGEARHADLRALAGALAFDELLVSHSASGKLVAELRYGTLQVPALLRVAEQALQLECEAPGAARAELTARRSQALRAQQLQARLLRVMKEQVDEGLPFDEPKTEDGQQDGHLRPEWRSAYLKGSHSYEFNGDRYSVFDASGRPRPPQVCIDFVLDTFERASGTWWQPAHLRRERVLGRLRFDDAAIQNRRSVERFVDFTRANPAAFEVYDLPPQERVPLRNRQQFFAQLYRSREHYRRGDIVAILGPREDEKLHYHSFFVVDVDPLSGMPTELAANAGRPRIRSWEGEMSNAPRRSIVARIRPRTVWLESFLAPDAAVSVEVPVKSASEPTAG